MRRINEKEDTLISNINEELIFYELHKKINKNVLELASLCIQNFRNVALEFRTLL